LRHRSAEPNQIRGLLAEFGLVISQGIAHIAKRVPELVEDASNELPGSFRLLVQRLLEQLKEFDRQVHEIENQIIPWHRTNDGRRKLVKVPGIAPITTSAMVASVGDAKSFQKWPTGTARGAEASHSLNRRRAAVTGIFIQLNCGNTSR